MHVCYGCGDSIRDQYILRVAPDLEWHKHCLRCTTCEASLDEDTHSCYIRNGKPYCKTDYLKLFAIRCRGCNEILDKNVMIMKARSHCFHVQCFCCSKCDIPLKPGDEYSLSTDGEIICKSDLDINERSSSSDDEESSVIVKTADQTDMPKLKCNHIGTIKREPKEHRLNSSKKDRDRDKPTRVRTVLNEKQLSTLKACYAANPRPDSVMKEQLVEMTGLSPRVIRVWFQNKRCKDKKRQILLANKDGMDPGQFSMHSSPLSDELSPSNFSPPMPSSISMSMVPDSPMDHRNQGIPNSNIGLENVHVYRNRMHYGGYDSWRYNQDYTYSTQDRNPPVATTPVSFQQLIQFSEHGQMNAQEPIHTM